MGLNIHTAVLIAYVEQKLGSAVARELEEVVKEERSLDEAYGNGMDQARKLLQRVVDAAGEDDNLGISAAEIVDQLESRKVPTP